MARALPIKRVHSNKCRFFTTGWILAGQIIRFENEQINYTRYLLYVFSKCLIGEHKCSDFLEALKWCMADRVYAMQ